MRPTKTKSRIAWQRCLSGITLCIERDCMRPIHCNRRCESHYQTWHQRNRRRLQRERQDDTVEAAIG